ncbi:MAG TPA: dTDP-glucose 4,6-dehydratase [bacterium]|nr:dTDP-glucose 4,6-dehydratase [bacterium]
MKVLVTGGAGFIGSNFVRFMLREDPDAQIVNFDKLTYAGNLDNLKECEANPRHAFVRGDIANAEQVREVLSNGGFDAIVNFAAETHVDRSIGSPSDFLNTDIFGTFCLLEAVREFAIPRYIQISTDEVYGTVPVGSSTETAPLNPSNPYSASKAGGDLLVLSYFRTYRTPVLITRASNNYGPNQYPEKFIPLATTNVLDDQPIPLYGDGMQIRDWLFVEDHCRGIRTVLLQGKEGEVYNIGGDQERPNREIAELILSILDKPRELIRRVADRPGHDTRYSLDCMKLKGLGWHPTVAVEEGMRQTVAWYRDNRWWWEKIKSGEFKKYYQEHYGHRLEQSTTLDEEDAR